MSISPRPLALCSALTAAFVLCSTASVASGYPSRQFGDWLFLLPLIAPIFAAAIAAGVFFLRTSSRVWSGCLWGAFAGANVLLIHQALRLTLQNELLRRDGTAYWGLLSMPAFYGGLGAMGVGAVLGLSAGFMVQRKELRRAEQDAAPNGGPAKPLGNSGVTGG